MSAPMTPVPTYVAEQFTDDEQAVLRRYFTNLDGPVFALVNLPEVVKGALFARYSRSAKSLRRLFLDEFVGELDTTGDESVDATIGLERAESLYDRVFFEYGDDSVAQLGGVHLACEQASNLLTKVLEWGRLMSYLEQSTRYIPYDERLGGRYRYHRDPEILASNLGARYVGDMDRLFDVLLRAGPGHPGPLPGPVPQERDRLRLRLPPGHPGQGVRRRPGHPARGVAVQRGHLRLGAGLRVAAAAHAGPPAAGGPSVRGPHAGGAAQGHPQLPQAGGPARTGAWPGASTCSTTGRPWRPSPTRCSRATRSMGPTDPDVDLVDFDPDGEVKVIAAMLYPYTGTGRVQAPGAGAGHVGG